MKNSQTTAARSTRLWLIRDVMRQRKISTITQLCRMLSVQIDYSYDQTKRLVKGEFRELPPLAVLDATCFVLRCSMSDLVPIDHRRADDPPLVVKTGRVRRPSQRRSHLDVVGNLKRLGDPTGVEPFPI